ncbi:hypothetical protein AQJ91_43635 [Streptomyces dysideae]|uniref:Uncharacterized protein n=1 Tax=Streptomyces dysideae TaxID=909626 RepID=A0A124IDF8_9ACTN|nr:hypothetical protein AQJ91_43635 [Streptomyces dysideae]
MGGPRGTILSSWQRCRPLAISPARWNPPYEADLNLDTPLIRAALPVLETGWSPGSQGLCGRLGAAVHPEPVEDATAVGLHGLLPDAQLARDLLVRLPAGEHDQDLGLTLGQTHRASDDLVDQAGDHGAGDACPPGRHVLHRVPQLVGLRVLQQETRRARPHRQARSSR